MVLAAAAALVALLWLSYARIKDALTVHPVAMPVPVVNTRTLKQPMLINIAVDESGSMGDSDPNNDRWKSVTALLRWLAKYERPSDMITITRFTDNASVGPTVSVKQASSDPRAMAADPAGGGTAFVPVVDAAAQDFARAAAGPPRAIRVVLIVTDGDATDRGQAVARLPHVADRVFLVALDRSNSWSSARVAWENGGFPVTTVSNKTPNEVGAALAKDVLRITGEKIK